MKRMLMMILSLGFAGTTAMAQGLVDSVWSGEEVTAKGYTHKLALTFNNDTVTLKSTCKGPDVGGGMMLSLDIKYNETATVAEVTSGFSSTGDFCDVSMPQGLKLELDNDQIYYNLDGKRSLANLTRVEAPASVVSGLLQRKATGELALLTAKNICENEKPGNAYEGHTCIPADGKTCYRPYKAQAKHCWGGWKKGFYRCGTLCAVPRKPKQN
ncbi:hypothetical protein [Bdellovibrio sp. HCB209]|uniref:hypothetical protein n=1 Tax=Bdellovibrio sp. HCB209 TaxID=3394354 RepID=UPI0039B36790